MCWKAAHDMDTHDNGGHALSGMNKSFSTDLMQRAVVDCMRVVGVNAPDRRSDSRNRIASRSCSRSTTPETSRCSNVGPGA